MSHSETLSSDLKIRRGLQPLAWLYGLGVKLRNWLYDKDILKGTEFQTPVICVGNITVGGTGKTPHIEYLIAMLQPDYRVAVVSRGYKRRTRGMVVATITSTTEEIGDEPAQIKRKFPNVTMVINANRCAAIRYLEQLPSDERPEVILLDDAYQHRRVKPSLSILLVDYNRLVTRDKFLPAGMLRDDCASISRAQVLIVTKCPDPLRPYDHRIIKNELELYPYQSLFFTSHKLTSLAPVFRINNTSLPTLGLDDLTADDALLIVSGIATPSQLQLSLQPYVKQIKCLSYPDHHRLRADDYRNIYDTYKTRKGRRRLIVTTEKDAVKMVDQRTLVAPLAPCLYRLPLKIEFQMGQEMAFLQIIRTHILQRRMQSQ